MHELQSRETAEGLPAGQTIDYNYFRNRCSGMMSRFWPYTQCRKRVPNALQLTATEDHG